jgi:hypothetical protein
VMLNAPMAYLPSVALINIPLAFSIDIFSSYT